VDPNTGSRRHALNPESEWVRTAVPELRIVDDELWMKVHANRRRNTMKTGSPRKPKQAVVEFRAARAHALTGLVHCGACGGMKTLADRGRYICEAFRRTRSCSNARGTSETVIGERMFAHLVSALRNETGLKVRLTISCHCTQ